MKKFILACLILFSANAYAKVVINITKGNVDPIPIAMNDIMANNSYMGSIGKEILSVINNDLTNCGLFRVINKASYIEKFNDAYQTPEFGSWRAINATAVFVAQISESMGGIKLYYRLWDPFSQKVLVSNSYEFYDNNWRKFAHKIADDIYSKLTGDTGFFNTKVAFVAETGNLTRRIKRIAIMDQDGANLEYLTNGRNLVLTPRFSHDSSKVLYLAYVNRKARVHMLDLKTKRDHVLGSWQGMSFAPRFSPDGREVVMSVAKNGVTDIYTIDLVTMQQKQLTFGNYIDTNPYYSPDGKKIVFSSDRSGRSHLYIMNRDGSDQKRISFGDGEYFSPVWSPRGDYIAYTKKKSRRFHIGVMYPDGSGERTLTEGYMVEGPNWSPNGRAIIFARGSEYKNSTSGNSRLQAIDVTGNFERIVRTPTDASDPNWSDLLN